MLVRAVVRASGWGRSLTSQVSRARSRVDTARLPYGGAPVLRDHLRLPDERSRFRADQGHARGDRARGSDERRRGRCRGLQHLHDPREARHEARRVPRRSRSAQARASGSGDRRRRLLCRGAARADLRALPVGRCCLRAGLDRAPRRVARSGRHGRLSRALRSGRPQLRRGAAAAQRALVPGVGAGLDGLQLEVLVLHRPGGARPRAEPSPGRDHRRGPGPCRSGRQRGHAARAERQLVGT